MMLDEIAIITHDNSMKRKLTISQQLRRRRKALGLSLSEVARRADTSPATLSRYENGWTRFETYTLRKLAAALESTLRVEFVSLLPSSARTSPAALCRRATATAVLGS